jgi:hypothetical protein
MLLTGPSERCTNFINTCFVLAARPTAAEVLEER